MIPHSMLQRGAVMVANHGIEVTPDQFRDAVAEGMIAFRAFFLSEGCALPDDDWEAAGVMAALRRGADVVAQIDEHGVQHLRLP